MDKPRVLFVDDEINVLNALKRGMRLHCRDWQVECCNSPEAALLMVSTFDPWVVVSDKRMPEMDGATFLHAVGQKSPEAVRVLLTGDTSPEVAFEVADIAHILLAKPFQFETIINVLHRIQCLHLLPVSHAIRHQIGAIEHFPVLPKVYQELVEYLKQDEIETQEVARIISQDPSILAKLMQLANSSFMGFLNHATSAHAVVVRLGTELIKNIVLCIGVFKQSERVDERLCEQLFVESMEVAKISRDLGKACGCSNIELDNAFVLGLLHNVGMLMAGLSVIQKKPNNSNIPFDDECVIGAYLLALWEFDNEFTNAVLYQNKPEHADVVTSLSCRLHVAKIVRQAQKQGVSALETQPALNQSLLQTGGLLDDVLAWINEYESKH
ncbi:HDOD domain-containing protein [Neptunomonas japonica]|uniref:HDOD domain-containing protein n=1 Tax=Neptunomonas japonica TaxID=417574 RepID=UPI0004211CE6|nr:HDOD domain-containing protein [Neptunomonas japonica]